MLGILLTLFAVTGPPPAPPVAPAPLPTVKADAPAQTQQFVVDDRTDVRLNGRPAKFTDVPETASVVRLDVAADGKTVTALWFRSKP